MNAMLVLLIYGSKLAYESALTFNAPFIPSFMKISHLLANILDGNMMAS
jgi:hypothetical protein